MILSKIKPYFLLSRLNRPVGTALLLIPSVFGLFFAKNHAKNLILNDFLLYLALFTVGSIIMRSAGCVINDIFDRNFDKKVARTSIRPIANGDISVKGAIIFLLFLLSCAFLILLQFNQKTIFSGFFALFLVILYPLMKRITFYPQLFLGITFNFGIIMADFAINNFLSFSTILLYISAIFWTFAYDTIYGFQDIEDDLKIGVKSSSIAISNNPQKILKISAFLMVFCLIFAGILQKSSYLYYIFIFLAFELKIKLIKRCDYDNPEKCLKTFKNNIFVGLFILIATVLN